MLRRIWQRLRVSRFYRWLLFLIQAACGFIALWWIVQRSAIDFGQLWQRLQQTNFGWFVLGVLCFSLVIVVNAYRYRVFLPGTVPLRYLIGVTLFQNALLTFVPWRIGEVGFPLLLRTDYQIPLANTLGIVTAIRMMDLLLLLFIALLGGGQLGWPLQGTWLFMGFILVTVLLVGFVLRRWKPAYFEFLLPVLTILRQRPFYLGVLSILIFVLTSLQSMWIIQAVGLAVTFPHIALLNAMGMVAALLPIHPPAGWGTMDSLQLAILERLGYSFQIAASSILAAHSLYVVLIFLGGGIGWVLRRLNLSTHASMNG